MLLKRFLVLAAAVLLFIVVFIVYFDVSHAQMEHRFQAERQKFGVEGAVLTAAQPVSQTETSIGTSTPPTDTNAPAVPTLPPANATTPDNSTAPAAADTNSAPTTPASDTNAAPNTNSAPAAAPSSTMANPGTNHLPFSRLVLSRSFGDGAILHLESRLAEQVMAVVAATPTDATTNPAPVAAPLPATVSSTNAEPQAASATNPPPAHGTAGDGKVIVLLYHQFKAPGVPIPAKFQWTMNSDVFASEMKYIHDNGYHVIPMSDLLKFLRHQITLPNNCVCITIDDGYKSAIVYAAPILKQYGYPWTFFIYPDFITVGEGPGAASWKDLLDLQAQGIDIECHSMTHPNMKLHHQKVKGVWHNFTPDEYAQWLNNETAGAKALLEQKMGKPITCFAYPYGEYNQQVENAVIAAGFEAIFTVADNPVHATTNLHSIGRYTITQGVEKNFTAYLRQGALELSSADPAPGETITNPRPVITATLGYPGKLDPKSIETSVRDFGDVRHDFDPATNTVRLYLPRDLIAPVALVNIRVRDAESGQVMVANWHFNFEPAGGAATPIHSPIAPATSSKPTASAATNAPAVTEPETLEKNAAGTPMDVHPAPEAKPTPPPQQPPGSNPARD